MEKHWHYHIKWSDNPDFDYMPFTSEKAAREFADRVKAEDESFAIIQVDATRTCGAYGAR